VVAGALLIAAGLQLPVTETTVRIGFVGAFVIVSGGVALIAGY
jgi:hypothetical protein